MKKYASAAAVVVFLALLVSLLSSASEAARLTPRWPGQKPGKVVLGMSCGAACSTKEAQLGTSYGVHRQFADWGDWRDVTSDIKDDHRHGRLPWVSVHGPQNGTPAGWKALAAGAYDSQIKALATTIKASDGAPILLTFHHEPSNDGTEAQGTLWAKAYIRFCDVLHAQGALANTSCVPILGDWLFNPANKAQDPAHWVTQGVLKRASFMGIDLYENGSGITMGPRLQRIIDWMAARGFPKKMVGIGEMGGTNALYPKKSSVQFINESLAWAKAHTNKIGVISYFNSTANSRTGVYWPLDESRAKITTYRRWLKDTSFIH